MHTHTHTHTHNKHEHTRTYDHTHKYTIAAEKKVQDLEGELERTKKAAEEEAKKKAEVEVAAAKRMADQEAAARKRAEEAAAAVAAAAGKKAAEEVCVLVCACVKSKPKHDPNTSKVNQNTTSACTFTLRTSLARLETCERRSRCNYVPVSISFSVLCTSNTLFIPMFVCLLLR